MSEALALKRALMLAVDLGHVNICFETDSLLLVKSIFDHELNSVEWRSRGIIQDIINLLAPNIGFSVTFLPRLGNAAADCLAAEASKGVYPPGWVNQPSPLLLSLLTYDAKKSDDPCHDALQDASSSLRTGVG